MRRLDAQAQYAVRGVFSPVCRGCFLKQNGWFSEIGSEEWIEASTGHSTDRMIDFDRERKVARADRKAAHTKEASEQFSAAWRCKMLQEVSVAMVEECSAAEGVGRAKRNLTGNQNNIKSKAHWVNAWHEKLCQQASCRRAFTMNERKHHCRVCGRVFCDTCSPKRLDVLEYALEHATEKQMATLEALNASDEDYMPLQRVCNECDKAVNAELQVRSALFFRAVPSHKVRARKSIRASDLSFCTPPQTLCPSCSAQGRDGCFQRDAKG